MCLWGNKADLSLSGGDPHFMSDTLFKELDDLRENVLVDHIDLVRDYLVRYVLSNFFTVCTTWQYKRGFFESTFVPLCFDISHVKFGIEHAQSD